MLVLLTKHLVYPENLQYFLQIYLSSYYIIHYEDLASDPVLHLRRLYDFMGLSFGAREEAQVKEHVEASPDSYQTKRYYSTFR